MLSSPRHVLALFPDSPSRPFAVHAHRASLRDTKFRRSDRDAAAFTIGVPRVLFTRPRGESYIRIFLARFYFLVTCCEVINCATSNGEIRKAERGVYPTATRRAASHFASRKNVSVCRLREDRRRGKSPANLTLFHLRCDIRLHFVMFYSKTLYRCR